MLNIPDTDEFNTNGKYPFFPGTWVFHYFFTIELENWQRRDKCTSDAVS